MHDGEGLCASAAHLVHQCSLAGNGWWENSAFPLPTLSSVCSWGSGGRWHGGRAVDVPPQQWLWWQQRAAAAAAQGHACTSKPGTAARTHSLAASEGAGRTHCSSTLYQPGASTQPCVHQATKHSRVADRFAALQLLLKLQQEHMCARGLERACVHIIRRARAHTHGLHVHMRARTSSTRTQRTRAYTHAAAAEAPQPTHI